MIEKAGVLYFRFFCYLYVLFSFVLIQKKKYQKEKIKAASARQTRPGGHAAWSAMQCRVLCGVIVCYVAL